MDKNSQEQMQQDGSGWSLSYGRKSFYTSGRPRQIPIPSARQGIERWKIEPRSIFDYDPIEDGKESLSLGFLHDAEEKTVYEAYGKRQFHRAREDNSLGIEEFYDPAHNNKPSLGSLHPGFHVITPTSENRPSDLQKKVELSSFAPPGVIIKTPQLQGVEVIADTPDFGENSSETLPNLRSFVYSPIPCGQHDFVPREIPIYTNFNRAAVPFARK